MDNIHQLFSADATFYVLTCFDYDNKKYTYTQNGRILPPNGPKLNFIHLCVICLGTRPRALYSQLATEKTHNHYTFETTRSIFCLLMTCSKL